MRSEKRNNYYNFCHFLFFSGEILILIFGVHLSYASRNATSQFQERCFLCMAITVEALVSGTFYFLRFFYWEMMQPDLSFVAYFARSQLTTTIVLLLIFIPKVRFLHKQSPIGNII